MIRVGLLPRCGRSDCDQVAVVVRVWRSRSDRRWQTTACLEHDTEDADLPAPGFVLVDERRFT